MELVGVGGAGLVGLSVGPPVGVGADGVILGEGTPVGLGIGRAVGERLGDGEALGEAVGWMLGEIVGSVVGPVLGERLGSELADGLPDGSALGVGEALADGLGVGGSGWGSKSAGSSQESPIQFWLASCWVGFERSGQLSNSSGMRSPSRVIASSVAAIAVRPALSVTLTLAWPMISLS